MLILSWNINGMKSWINKGGLDTIKEINPDIICLQEIKATDVHIIDNYHIYWNPADKKGYAGTAIYSKIEAERVEYNSINNDEGRITTAYFDNFVVISTYFPNSGNKLERLNYRLKWDNMFLKFISKIDKPIISCGDFNISQTELDIAQPKKHLHHPGYTIEERNSFQDILDYSILTDIYRYMNKQSKIYTFWSYLADNFNRNIGYRCDLFCVSFHMIPYVTDVKIYNNVRKSDHCPVVLILDDKKLKYISG